MLKLDKAEAELLEGVLTQAINATLYRVDPMRTGCAENNLADEYSKVADYVVEVATEHQLSLTQSLKMVFDQLFWEDALSEQAVQRLSEDITQVIFTLLHEGALEPL